MSKKIMILGASILQLPAIEKAKEMGYSVVAVDMNPEAIGFQVPGIETEVISTIDIPLVLEAARKHKIDGVMTLASDMPMRTVAVVARELGLVGVSEDTALKATDKAVMRQCLQEAGVPVPMFFKVENETQYAQTVKKFRVPFVVKPADNSGSRGIVLVDDPADSEAVEKAYPYSRRHSRNGNVVVEEYMRGPEVSVETLSVNGVCHVIQITDKLTTGAPHFVEMGHSQPTGLSDETAEKIRQVVIAANKAVGIQNGPSHTEVIVTAEGPKIVEIGARLGGDCITTHLVPLSTGVNMVECCIRIALGEAPDLAPKFRKGSAIRYFAQHPGTVRAIEGVETAAAIPGVQQVSIVHGVGEAVTEIDSSAARMGFVVAQGSNAKDAVAICQSAIDSIKIVIK